MGIFATLYRNDADGFTVSLYRDDAPEPFACVEGSWEYVLRGLMAAGLAPPPVGGLAEDGGGRQRAFVGSEPSHGHPQRLRQANKGSGLYARTRLPLKP